MDKINLLAIKEFCSKNVCFLMFWCFFVLYLLLGVILNCQTDAAFRGGWDVVYALDTRSRMFDFTEPFVKGFAYPEVHPFQLVTTPAIVFPFKFLGFSNIFTVILVQSILGAGSVCFVYKILELVSNSRRKNLLLSFVYALSFSILLFVSSPENYIFVTFFSSVNLYYVLKCRNLEKLSWINIFVLAFMSVLMYSINLICIAYSLVLIFYLLFCIYGRKFKEVFAGLFKFLIILFSFTVLFAIAHKTLYPHLESVQDLFIKKEVVETKIDRHNNLFTTKKFNKDTLVNVFEGVFVKPFYALKSEVRVDNNNLLGSNWNFVFGQEKEIYYPMGFFLGIPLLAFVFSIFLHFVSKFCNHSRLEPFKDGIKHIGLTTVCFILLCMNILFSTLYASWECFLYSLNAFIYFVILIGLLAIKCNEKIFMAVTLLFIFFQIIMNFGTLGLLRDYLYINSSPNHYFNIPIYSICIFLFLAFLLTFFIKEKMQKVVENISTEKKYLICVVVYIMLIIIYSVFEYIFKV